MLNHFLNSNEVLVTMIFSDSIDSEFFPNILVNWHRWSFLAFLVNFSDNSGLRIITRGSKFWSSKVCEGGESREAYACRLNFDPPQFLSEINDHVTKIHFWSAFKSIENLILIQFELMKMDQKRRFERFINHEIMNCSKFPFWSTFLIRTRSKQIF